MTGGAHDATHPAPDEAAVRRRIAEWRASPTGKVWSEPAADLVEELLDALRAARAGADADTTPDVGRLTGRHVRALTKHLAHAATGEAQYFNPLEAWGDAALLAELPGVLRELLDRRVAVVEGGAPARPGAGADA